MLTFEQVTSEVRFMSVEQRKQLIGIIVNTLIDDVVAKTHSILEFEGIGERFRDGTDAQAYVDQLRSEWDERP